MAKNILVFFFFLSSLTFSQSTDSLQQKTYERGINNLENKDLIRAYNSFKSAYLFNSESSLGKKSFSNLDSLKIILRKNIQSKINGIWLKKNSLKEFLIITQNEFTFFNCEDESIKIEKLIFNDKINYNSYFFEIIYSDNKLWRIFISDENELSIENCGNVYENELRYKNHGDVFYYSKIK
jgi:hypothetical protein